MPENPIEQVQNAYEKTLVESQPLSPTTDHLARRLSRELKIRRYSEQRVIRSPSARKIGSMRRRSREIERQNAKVSRNQSWHVAKVEIINGSSLKRGRTNTILTGLKTPVKKDFLNSSVGSASAKKTIARSASFNPCTSPSSIMKTRGVSNSLVSNMSNEKWTSAEGFFTEVSTPKVGVNAENCRASIARLRSQNAGMVLAKAKLFDGVLSDSSTKSAERISRYII